MTTEPQEPQEPHEQPAPPPQPDAQTGQQSRWYARLFTFTSLLMVVAVVTAIAEIVLLAVYAGRGGGMHVFVVSMLVSAAAGVVGLFGGFLFGLPRYSPLINVQPATDGAAPSARQIKTQTEDFVPSNNLEQVSDWLTKILIGAGLVQLGALGRWFGRFTDVVAGALSGAAAQATAETRVLAGSILILNTLFGFPIGYMLTTLWYSKKVNRLHGGGS